MPKSPGALVVMVLPPDLLHVAPDNAHPAIHYMTQMHDIGFVAAVREVDGRLQRGFRIVVGGGWPATVLPVIETAVGRAGAVLCWARALGEFGATIMFAGNLPGVSQTMPLAVYVGMESDYTIGIAISMLLVIISFAIMIAVRLIARKEGLRA